MAYNPPSVPQQNYNPGYEMTPNYGQPVYVQQQPVYVQQQPVYVQQQPQPQQPQETNVVVNQNPTPAGPVPLGRYSQQAFCPRCNSMVTTIVTYSTGIMALLLCCFFTLMGVFFIGLIFLCINSLNDANHYCPICRTKIGTKSAF